MTTSSSELPDQPSRPLVSDERHTGRSFQLLVRTLVRLVILSGFAALAMATLHTARTSSPDWFQSPIYQSCKGVAVELAIIWGVAELLMASTHRAGRLFWVLTIAMAGVYVPWHYGFWAAWYGQSVADWETWHLLPLFAVVNMALVTTMVGAVSAVVIALCSFVWRFYTARTRHPDTAP